MVQNQTPRTNKNSASGSTATAKAAKGNTTDAVNANAVDSGDRPTIRLKFFFAGLNVYVERLLALIPSHHLRLCHIPLGVQSV